MFVVGAAGVLFVMFMWWRDVIREAHGGDHTPVVQLHLRYGMIMFIASEVMFFVAWFWAYFDVALFPAAVHPLEVTGPDGTMEATKSIDRHGASATSSPAATGRPRPAPTSRARSTRGACRWSTP